MPSTPITAQAGWSSTNLTTPSRTRRYALDGDREGLLAGLINVVPELPGRVNRSVWSAIERAPS